MSIAAGPRVPIPDEATAHGLLLDLAAASPQAPALRLPDRDISYAQLLDRAHAVRQLLSEHGVGPGSFVPVAAQPGAACVVAVVGVLLSGAAYCAVDPAWPAARLAGIVQDLGAEVILDARDPAGAEALPVDDTVRVLALPDSAASASIDSVAHRPAPVAVGAGAPACVFFTSGSTGRPKGVVVPHRAVIRTFIDGGYADFGPDTVMPLIAAPYWDAGALEMFGPLLNGGCAVEAAHGLVSPAELRRLIDDQGVNTLWLTSSLTNLIVDEEPGAFAGLRQLMTGGERLSPPRMARLLTLYPDLRLTNGYGPVESMVFVSTHDLTSADPADPDGIPLGKAVRNTILAVVSPEGRQVPAGDAGELWVGGDGLALGYLNRPQEDAARFGKLELANGAVERIYRTGDLVRMTGDGRLSYLGRADRQFKLRGYRIEPDEVERLLGAIPWVESAFVLPITAEDGSVTGLAAACAVADPDHQTSAELASAATRVLPAYLRPDRFLLLDSVPLGPTGKADLQEIGRLVREGRPDGRDAEPVVEDGGAPASATLTAAREILAYPTLRADEDLLTLGANSLQVLRIAARFSHLLRVELSARDVYEGGTVAELSRIAATRPARGVSQDAARKDEGELSPGQKRFWLAERIAPKAPGHVAVSRVEVIGAIDPASLASALEQVASAHPALRTTFPTTRGRPHRVVAAQPALPPFVHRRSGADPDSSLSVLIHDLAATVHDLGNGPLLAAGLLTETEPRHTLVLAVHHSVYDGQSERVLLADLAAALQGSAPVPTPAPEAEPGTPQDLDFWRAETAAARPLSVPGARVMPARELLVADLTLHSLSLPTGTDRRVRELAARLRCPILAVHLAAWGQAVARWCGHGGFAVGTVLDTSAPTPESRRGVGYLANSVPIRFPELQEPSGSGLIATVGARLLDAFAHAATPTDEIAAVGPRPADGRMPLFQTLFALQRVTPPLPAGAATLRPRPAAPLGPQAELCCEIWEDGEELTGTLHAPAGLFPADTLPRLAADYADRLAALLDEPFVTEPSKDTR